MTAQLLERHGINHLLFERRERPMQHPRAMGMTRRSGEIFRQLGLGTAIQQGHFAYPDQLLGLWSKGLTGEVLGQIPLPGGQSPLSPCPILHCPQTVSESVLWDCFHQAKHGKAYLGHDVNALREEGDHVYLSVTHGDKTIEVVADYVVAADGAASPTRHFLGIETQGPGDMGHFLNIYFEADYAPLLEDRRAYLYNTFHAEGFEVFVSVDGGRRWLMHHFLMNGEKPEDYSLSRLTELIRQASGHPDIPVNILGVNPWVMSPKCAVKLRAGRVFLTGDAAARLSPAGGLGLNTGIQSAHNLAWKLAAVIKGLADDALLDSYNDERLPVGAATMGNTNENAREVFQVVDLAMQGRWDEVREKLTHSRRAKAGLGQDLGTAYSQGAFYPDDSPDRQADDCINNYCPDARPGMRAPHLFLEKNGDRISILDTFLPNSFTLVTGDKTTLQPPATLPLQTVVIGQTGWHDTEGRFPGDYGIEPDGAVLVRPDGYVAARLRTGSAVKGDAWLERALQSLGWRDQRA